MARCVDHPARWPAAWIIPLVALGGAAALLLWSRSASFLNRNGSAIQGLATVFLVFLTAWYAYLTRRVVLATERSRRPYVFIDFSAEGPLQLSVVVANSGDRAAEDVRFSVIGDLTEREGKRLSTYTPFRDGIVYLPPGRRYLYDFLVSEDFSKSYVHGRGVREKD